MADALGDLRVWIVGAAMFAYIIFVGGAALSMLAAQTTGQAHQIAENGQAALINLDSLAGITDPIELAVIFGGIALAVVAGIFAYYGLREWSPGGP